MQSLTITNEQLNKIIAHVDSQLPLEACGLLAGRGSRVESLIEVTNQAQSPVRYVMDPIEQLKAFEWIESQGLELLGIFHSHPTGPETVSPTDIADSAYSVVHVVLSRMHGEWRARAFWIEDEGHREVPLEVSNQG
ncbi:MAG: hypothetical protein JETCAE01_00880 [Anaerolineaceae bacterium]|nr:MAG: hypothetical protein JETCAE01_00880 [Anaerolineaceae bacterium]